MNVLTLLPEGRLFDFVYAEAIAPALGEANASSIRIPLDLKTEPARIAVSDAITKADLVLLDLTGKSPSAMYAAGLAAAGQRKTLFLLQHLEEFPFEPNAHKVIAYAGDRPFLKSELITYLSGNERAQPSSTAANSARDKFLSTFGDILEKHRYTHHGDITLENPTTFVLLNQDMELALVQDLARRARELGLRLKLM